MSTCKTVQMNEAIRHLPSVYSKVAFSTLPSVVNIQRPTLACVYLVLPFGLVLEIIMQINQVQILLQNSTCQSLYYLKLEFS